MRDVAVAADFIGRVDHDDPALLAQDAGSLAQQRRLAHARPAQQQNALARLNDVFDDVDDTVDGPADPTGEADDLSLPVANRGDAMQRAFNARAVVARELADARDYIIQVVLADFPIAQHKLMVDETRLGHPTQVHDDLEKIVSLVGGTQSPFDLRRQHLQQSIEIVGYLSLFHTSLKNPQASASGALAARLASSPGGTHPQLPGCARPSRVRARALPPAQAQPHGQAPRCA